MKQKQIYTCHEVQNWDAAKSYFENCRMGWAFRGQRTDSWDLKPTIERLRSKIPYYDAEKVMLQEFSRRVHLYLDRSKLRTNDTLEILAFMQHHGAPTRLLDWTYSAYVASYFAFEQPNFESDNVAVWAIDIQWLKKKTDCRIEQISKDPVLQNQSLFYANTHTWDRQDFSWNIMNNRLKLVAPQEPYYMNERMTVQQGLFLVSGDLKVSFMENLESYTDEEIMDHLIKIVIPNNARLDALADLYHMNINRTSLFPGVDGFTQSFNTRFEI